MSQFETKCPHCGTTLSVQEEWIGMNVECPECKQEFPIQKNLDQSIPVLSPNPTPAPARTNNGETFTFVCPSCGAVAELPAALLGQKYECQMCFEEHIAQATTDRQCPFCGQTIKYHATVCKFCKADLTKAPPPSAPKPEETFVFICPECDTVEFLPVSMKGQQYECKKCCETSTAEPAEERKCPHCGEKIKIKAAVCKHCKQPVKPLSPSPTGGGASHLKQRGARLFAGRQTPQLQPVGTPPPQMQPAYNNLSYGQQFWGITEAERASLLKTGTRLLIWGCISMIFFLFVHPMISLAETPIPIFFIYLASILARAAGGAACVFGCIWIYKLWKQVPVAEAETTPGKAVGFCFIPFYNIYWGIMMPLWLARHFEQFNESVPTLSKCWLSVVYSQLITVVIYIIFIVIAIATKFSPRYFLIAWTVIVMLFGTLNAVLGFRWILRLQKCVPNIPQVG